MEGVVDYGVRDVLTRVGGYDRCVTEFVRVNEQPIPEKVFLRYSPELEYGGTTSSGVPVYLQLLGGNYKWMAINANLAQRMEPPGIDLNFGCPSKTVTKSEGGSALLKEPQRVSDIVSAVRDAVDPAIPVTAKIRLGFSNHDYLEEIASRVQTAGANELCVHARTREDRYKPPAYWSAVKPLSASLKIPIIINGEIWTPEDANNAQVQSGCIDLMLGRSALARPDLGLSIKASSSGEPHKCMSWLEVLAMLIDYLTDSEHKHPLFVSNRCKQWLVFLQRQYSQAVELFHEVKRLKEADEVFAVLNQHLIKKVDAI